MLTMLTQNDFKKLKQIFATKDDFNKFPTKDDLKKFATKDDLKNFATKDDLKKFVTKDDLDHVINELIELIMPPLKKIDELVDEIRGHHVAIGDHEERIQSLENKFTPTTL